MREYKFRGKRIDNGEWVYGYLIIDEISDKYYIFCKGNSCNESDKFREEGLLHILTFEVNKDTIGQYTGLHDKKGQEIYEGDIVRFPANDEYDEVNYISYECWFDSRDTFKYGWHFSRSKFHGCLCGGNSCVSMEWARQLEIIGNVHDNKELLEG